jgi:hypothetical protein
MLRSCIRARTRPKCRESRTLKLRLGKMMLIAPGGTCDPRGALALFKKPSASGTPPALQMLGDHVADNQADKADADRARGR